MKTYEERMASVEQKLQRKKRNRRILSVTAGALCLCIVAGIFFIPFGNTEQNADKYADSEYYKVIAAIERDIPNYDRSEIWFEDDLVFEGAVPVAPGAAPDANDIFKPSVDLDTGTNESTEITDHQVAGVLEADIIKRSQTHIFYLKDNTLEIYPIAGENTQLLKKWTLATDEHTYYYSTEMYLSADATQITLIISGHGPVLDADRRDAFTQLVSLDVSDPVNVQEVNSCYVTGSLLSARMVEERLLVMSRYCMDDEVNFDDQATFLPRVGTPGKMKTVPGDKIVVPDQLDNQYYTVVTLLDSKDMAVIDSAAFMSCSTKLYVSAQRIYATRVYTEEESLQKTEHKEIRLIKTMMDISCMTYGAEGLVLAGSFAVEGAVDNQYYMDEHKGIFRIVTETFSRNVQYRPNGTVELIQESTRNANLYCFQVGTWEQKAVVEQFAPDGETVESVRFDGDFAYVCTAVVVTLTDPVFFFDMTDLDNIIVKDTGVIDGYSSSLIQLKNGLLLGIGFDENRYLKVEVYKESENGVDILCTFVENRGTVATEYKAYYIDRENNLFGIPTGDGYLLLLFDGHQLVEYATAKVTGYCNKTRGVVIDKYLYVFGDRWFDVVKLA